MSAIIKIFWNSSQARVRAGWRLIIQLVVMMLFITIFAIFDSKFNDFLPESAIAEGDTILFPLWIFLSSLISIWLVGRFIDKRRLADFGLRFSRSWWIQLGFGAALASFLMTGIFLIEKAFSWVSVTETCVSKIDGIKFPAAILLALGTFALAAISEELIARGYQIKNAAEGLNFRPLTRGIALMLAMLFSSMLFGLGHAVNPEATTISTLGLFLTGIFYGLSYVLTGELALPIGFHIAWNFFENSVFGFPVSGENIGVSFIGILQRGPVILTGGAFGPEAGLFGIGAHLVAILAVLVWARLRQGRIILLEELAEPDLRKSLLQQ
jgi:membrane protease YdiL (CAAX protease family)